ncbi:MAG: hypothetical protein ACM3OB_04445 [Acidobacteriota bacterium]
MTLIQVDTAGLLYISPAIADWQPVVDAGIETVIDLEGAVDLGVPSRPNEMLYVYFPIFDEGLPDLERLSALADLGAGLVRNGRRVLAHCGMGYNRSALMAGLILHRLGIPGPQAVAQIRRQRPGALFNTVFAEYLETLR